MGWQSLDLKLIHGLIHLCNEKSGLAGHSFWKVHDGKEKVHDSAWYTHRTAMTQIRENLLALSSESSSRDYSYIHIKDWTDTKCVQMWRSDVEGAYGYVPNILLRIIVLAPLIRMCFVETREKPVHFVALHV